MFLSVIRTSFFHYFQIFLNQTIDRERDGGNEFISKETRDTACGPDQTVDVKEEAIRVIQGKLYLVIYYLIIKIIMKNHMSELTDLILISK